MYSASLLENGDLFIMIDYTETHFEGFIYKFNKEEGIWEKFSDHCYNKSDLTYGFDYIVYNINENNLKFSPEKLSLNHHYSISPLNKSITIH